MRSPVRAFGLFWLCAAGCFLADSEPGSWVRVASVHFELYTTANEEAGRNLVGRFERLRTVLRPVLAVAGAPEKPVCIIAFGSIAEFQPYTPVGHASGFFLAGTARDFIVLDGPSIRTRTAAHEYGHLVIAQSGYRLPTWLNEGLAELYSNVESGPSDAHAVVGLFIPGRVRSLRRDGWIGLVDLVSASADSPVFTGAALAESAYAESWLLAHMLAMDRRYADRFRPFLSVIRTAGTAEAFARVYGKSIADVELDLHAYLETGQANARVLDIGPPEAAQSIEVEWAADFDARLALADMLRKYPGRSEQSRGIYRQLARDYPLRPEVQFEDR